MRSTMIVGLVLIVLGLFLAAYEYIPPRREAHHIGVGPIGVGVVTEEEGSNPLPLILGVGSIIIGLYLVLKRS